MTAQELINQVHNKLSAQLPEPPAGGHWMFGVAAGGMGLLSPIKGVSIAEMASPFEYIDHKKMPDPHPWLTNLRDYARMLNGEIEIPHEIKLSGNARQRRRQRRAEERGDHFLYQYRCQECLKAAKQRRAYKRHLENIL